VLVFSAVFLGFLADNFRDQYSERQKAGELARSFYEELINDSIAIAAKVQGRIKKGTYRRVYGKIPERQQSYFRLQEFVLEFSVGYYRPDSCYFYSPYGCAGTTPEFGRGSVL
jgi:hypothetical protein